MTAKTTTTRSLPSRLFSRLSPLLLLASLFPVGVLATWSTPGEDFSDDLTFGGPVTSTRNPWVWKILPGEDAIVLAAGDRLSRGKEQIWSGLLKGGAVLLGKTTQATPAGREGLAPWVSFGRGLEGAALVWASDSEGQVTLPVFDAASPTRPVGALTFRLQAVMMLRHIQGGQPVDVGVYSDLPGNGLPPQGLTLPAGQITRPLCGLFAGEGPAWLCAGPLSVQGTVALSALSDRNLRQIQAVYGAGIVAGSGELRLPEGRLPARWKTTLPVSIAYQ